MKSLAFAVVPPSLEGGRAAYVAQATVRLNQTVDRRYDARGLGRDHGPENVGGQQRAEQILQEQLDRGFEHAADVVVDLLGVPPVAPGERHVVRVFGNVFEHLVGVFLDIVLFRGDRRYEGPRGAEDHARDRQQLKERQRGKDLNRQDALITDVDGNQNDPDDPSRDERDAAGEDDHPRVVELPQVRHPVGYAARHALFEDMGQLVVLSEVPLGQRSPAGRVNGALGIFLVKLVRDVEHKVTDEEKDQEGHHQYVEHGKQADLAAEPARRAPVAPPLAHAEARVENVANDDLGQAHLQTFPQVHRQGGDLAAADPDPDVEIKKSLVDEGDEHVLLPHDSHGNVQGAGRVLVDLHPLPRPVKLLHSADDVVPRHNLKLTRTDFQMLPKKLAHPANAPDVVEQEEVHVPRAVDGIKRKERQDDPAPQAVKFAQRILANEGLAVARVLVLARVLQGLPVHPHEHEAGHRDREKEGQQVRHPRADEGRGALFVVEFVRVLVKLVQVPPERIPHIRGQAALAPPPPASPSSRHRPPGSR